MMLNSTFVLPEIHPMFGWVFLGESTGFGVGLYERTTSVGNHIVYYIYNIDFGLITGPPFEVNNKVNKV